MPKKRTQSYFSKPPTSAHPSISNRQHDSHHDEESEKSVNDLLQQLRVTQASSAASAEPRSDVNPQTVYPSLKHILRIPETPPPRPRPGTRSMAAHGRRRPPGPPPPRSWLQNSIRTSSRSVQNHNTNLPQRPNLVELATFPDLHLPSSRSLRHHSLVLLARNWDFHVHYDRYYLPLLPIRYKQLLLTYIAAHSPNGIHAQGLSTLFANDSFIEDANGTEGLTHLDLSVSVGRSLALKDLKQFIIASFPIPTILDSTPDLWDVPIPFSPNPTCTLTHLSLSYPPPSISWRHLIQLSPHLSTLTHLSLSHWPSPSITPNSTTAYRSTPSGDISYGDHDLYSASLDEDFSGPANVLRQLSRDTYCLQWLDLSGCSSWLPALVWRKGGGVDWDGPWSGVTTIVVAQGWIPECLKDPDGRELHWKAVLHCHSEDLRMKNLQRELKAWAKTERETEAILKRIRGENVSGRSAVVGREDEWGPLLAGYGHGGPQRRRRVYDDDANETLLQADTWERHKEKSENVNRTRRVEFERGWEGWWIEDCLKEYQKMVVLDD
ncbi:MAG: hypothetical protein Q9209_001030 [Squamulea sp. 1 TL-2023]